MADASLSVELEARVSNFVSGMRQAGTVSQQTAKTVTSSTSKIASAVTSQLAGAFSAAAFVSFGKAVLDVTSEFQKFNAVLGNTLGSSTLASLKLKEIQDFAAKTPFGVNELTGAFVKLANSGFKPTGDQMRALGDLASSTGKSFDQLAEAILDAQSGEFERLKEFGVRAKDAGDSVIFTYKGVQTQVAKTSEAIRGYITDLGNAEGVSGSMAKISETLGGKISNLGDSWDQMLLSVGGNTEGVFNSAIDVISKAINKVTDYNNELALASKYDLGNGAVDFAQRLGKLFGGGSTDIELQAKAIQSIATSVQNTATKAISGAKSLNDFGAAIAQLKKQGDAQLATATKNGANSGQIKAVKDAYQFGIKALQDARTSFGASSGKEGGNFGTAKAAKNVKDLSSVLKDLDKDLEKSENQFNSTFSKTNEAKISAYQKAIDNLVELGFDKASEAVIKLKTAQQGLFQLTDNGSAKGTQEALERYKASIALVGGSDIKMPKIGDTDMVKRFNELLAKQKQLKEEFNEGFSSLAKGGAAEALGSGFAAIGESLVNGGSIIEAAGNALLTTLSSFLSELGQLAIQKGTATVLIGLAMNGIFPGSGAKTIASGASLIAAGAALSLGGGLIGAGRSKSSNSGKADSRPTAFANGGVVFGPTNALIGEYAGARNNPEVVAPLSKLKSMIGGGEQIFIAESTIRGQDLVTVFRKASSTLRRVN